MRARVCVCITLFALSHPQLGAQTLTRQLPPPTRAILQPPVSAPAAAPTAAGPAAAPAADQQDDGGKDSADEDASYPLAQPIPEPAAGTEVVIHARTQSKQGSVFSLKGAAEIDYKNYVVHADEIQYDSATGQVTANGNLRVDGGPRDEHLSATNGTFNIDRQTGRFFNVFGSLGGRSPGQARVYGAENPFLFTGKMVEKDGPDKYVIHDGSVTSCTLPNPDWLLNAKLLAVNDNTATAKNVTFRLLRVPLVYLPYATHTTDVRQRHSGFLIPTAGTSSVKGTILGESIYLVLGRSADLTVGAEYYSDRGFSQTAEFRYKGRELDGLRVRYTGLQDRGREPLRIDQGGVDITTAGRRDFSPHLRAVADAEYLSSYVYRQAFTESFFQAVSSEVKSAVFLTHQQDGFIQAARFDRYQHFRSTANGDEVRILHLPSVEVGISDHELAHTHLYYGLQSSAAGLSRAQPSFTTHSPIARFDVHPYLTLPLVFGGALLRPSVGVRETFYSDRNTAVCCTAPSQIDRSINRNVFEAAVELRTPTFERVFGDSGPDTVRWKHTIAGYAQYRYVSGVENFPSILRYDPIDIVSNTNEIEYGLVQRLFRRNPRPHPCGPEEVPDAALDLPSPEYTGPDVDPAHACTSRQPQQWLSWQVAQKYFFDPNFGGALLPGLRNVFATTLDFSAAAYLTAPRTVSPVVSRLRIRAAEQVAIESDVEYDTVAGRIAAANVFADYRRGDYFASFGHSRLVEPVQTALQPPLGSASIFDQIRFGLGYGNARKRGLSAAANAGLDLELTSIQYGSVQTNYNFNCCGFSVEYRRFALGSARNENQYRFSFTLAGVGSAGNLRRAERLF